MQGKTKRLLVSDKLGAFIEEEFKSMLRFEKEQEEDRTVKRPGLKKKEQRESKRAKRAGGVEWKKPNPISSRELAIKGKAKLDFNNFVYMCDHLLRKENVERVRLEKCHRVDIHRWISNFLTEKNYEKKNAKPYTSNDIKRIINYRFEDYSGNYFIREYFESFVDHLYSSFLTAESQ